MNKQFTPPAGGGKGLGPGLQNYQHTRYTINGHNIE
jgi:hypothetical protein